MRIEYTVHIWLEDKQHIAHAMPINVASSGATPEAARLAVDEAVGGFLKTAAEHGTLREVLEESGYREVSGEWRRPAWSSVEDRSLLVEV